jgi:hypothetical protein
LVIAAYPDSMSVDKSIGIELLIFDHFLAVFDKFYLAVWLPSQFPISNFDFITFFHFILWLTCYTTEEAEDVQY